MRVISMRLSDIELARIEEGKFVPVLELKNRQYGPDFKQWYEDCFYGIKNSRTFDERYELVESNGYFCYSKPELTLIAMRIDE